MGDMPKPWKGQTFDEQYIDRHFTRREEVREFISCVGMQYFTDRGKVERALLNYWERGIMDGKPKRRSR